MTRPCDICMELWRAGFGDVQCSVCDAPAGNNPGNDKGRTLATSDPDCEIPKDSGVREGGLEPPHG